VVAIMNAATTNNQEQAMSDEEVVTGRLEKNGQLLSRKVTASIRSGAGISFLFPPNRIKKGDALRLLVSPDRVIDFDVVYTFSTF
jgi:hypothetical protein